MIKDRVKDVPKYEWKKFKWFQPAGLKEASEIDIEKLTEKIQLDGIIRSFKCWRRKSGIYLLDGHLLKKVLEKLGDEVPEKLSAEFIEVDNEKQAAQFVLDYSSYWHKLTYEGLVSFKDQYNLELMDLNLNLPDINIHYLFGEENNPHDEWQGMPEFNQEDKTAFKTIQCHFLNQDDVNEFAELINQKITDKTKYIWFPKQEKAKYMDKIYK